MRFWIKVPKNERTVKTKALLDSGATHSFISDELVNELGIHRHPLPKPVIVKNADGTENVEGRVTHRVLLPFIMNKKI